MLAIRSSGIKAWARSPCAREVFFLKVCIRDRDRTPLLGLLKRQASIFSLG